MLVVLGLLVVLLSLFWSLARNMYLFWVRLRVLATALFALAIEARPIFNLIAELNKGTAVYVIAM